MKHVGMDILSEAVSGELQGNMVNAGRRCDNCCGNIIMAWAVMVKKYPLWVEWAESGEEVVLLSIRLTRK